MSVLEAPRPDFEQPVVAVEEQIRALESEEEHSGASNAAEIKRLQRKCQVLLKDIYRNLTPWQIVSKVARHPDRPQSTRLM